MHIRMNVHLALHLALHLHNVSGSIGVTDTITVRRIGLRTCDDIAWTASRIRGAGRLPNQG